MPEDTDCIVCQKHRGTVHVLGGAIAENDTVFISHAQLWGDEKDHYLGHVFIEPKRHVQELSQLTEHEAREIGSWMKRCAALLESTCDVDHVYSFVIGDGVPHVHVHVIGRYRGAPKEFWGPKVDEWPGAPRGDEKAISDLVLRMREAANRQSALA